MIEVLKQALDAMIQVSPQHHLMPNRVGPKEALAQMMSAIASLHQAIAELESQERNFCQRCGKRVGGIDSIHTCTPPQRTEPVGVMVSMDVSKGDEPEYRIFGRIYEVMKDGADEVTYLAIEDSRNFDSPLQREWVGLTDEEFDELDKEDLSLRQFVQAIEDRLKEKNT